MNEIERQITVGEHRQLEQLLSDVPDKKARLKEAIENVFVTLAGSLLVLFLLWLLLAWLLNLISGVNIGVKSDYSLVILSALLSISGLIAVSSTVSWMKSWKDPKPEIQEDIHNGRVREQNYQIVDFKRFQEQEYGGFIYFLKIDGLKESYVMFDSESQDLAISGKDPLKSSFNVRSNLKIVKTIIANWVIEETFSGDELADTEAIDMLAPPDKWFLAQTWCDVEWDNLENYFCNQYLNSENK